jgi:hypothetical protein
MRRLHRSLGLAALVAAALAGCGGSGKQPGTGDPASLVPASAPVYVEVVVRPQGTLRKNTADALTKLLRTRSPGRKVRELFDSIDKDVKFDRDVKPWLGQRAGIFFTRFTDSPTGALILATTDVEKARRALSKNIRESTDGGEPDVEKRRYHGISYEVGADDTATGIVRGFAVLANEAGFKQVVDTRPSRSLARSADYRQAKPVPPEPADSLATAYVDLRRLLDALRQDSILSRDDLALLDQVLETSNTRALGLGLVADADKVALDIETIASRPFPADQVAPADVGSLPGDAWLAISIGDVGKALRDQLDQLETVAAFGGQDIERALKAVRTAYGLDIRRDLLSWMGDVGLFIRGTSLGTLSGAVVIESTSRRRSAAAVPKLARFFRRVGGFSVDGVRLSGVDAGIAVTSRAFPLRILLASAGDRFIVAVTEAALREALNPSSTLADTGAFRIARQTLGHLGDAPSFFLNTPTLLSLVERLGLGTDTTYLDVKPYLDVLGPIIASQNAIHERGGRGVGRKSRIALGLR